MHAEPARQGQPDAGGDRRRPDGFHELDSVFLRIGLADDLTVSLGDRRGRDVLTVGGLPGCPVDGNLVLRAWRAAFDQRWRQDLPPLVPTWTSASPWQPAWAAVAADAAAALDAALQSRGVSVCRRNAWR